MSATGSILTNLGALNALNAIGGVSASKSTLQTQLSSGLSINSPADNPAGYLTSQGFTAQLNGVTQAISNANQGVSLLQTAQGAVQQQIGVTQQLNAIAVQAANGTQTAQEAQSLQELVQQLTSQVSSIAANTQFNNINLLDGSFTNTQLQVGANVGENLNVSIPSTSANDLGFYTSTANTAVDTIYDGQIYAPGDGTLSEAYQGNPLAIATGVPSGFFNGTVSWMGSSGATASAVVTSSETAASIAASVNASAAATGVSAQANTQITLDLANSEVFGPNFSNFTFSLSPGTPGYSFTIGSSASDATININAADVAGVVEQVNAGTAQTGVSASLASTSGQVVFTDANGDNIEFTNVNLGLFSAAVPGAGVQFGLNGFNIPTASVQGQVTFQSANEFTLSGAQNIGLNNGPTTNFLSLANINVSTLSGANAAINVVKYALAQLGNTGSQLGATQQALTASINNLNASSQNITSALAVVQDANIPAVSNALTQAQIETQAGVAALKNSSALQKSFLSLLP